LLKSSEANEAESHLCPTVYRRTIAVSGRTMEHKPCTEAALDSWGSPRHRQQHNVEHKTHFKNKNPGGLSIIRGFWEGLCRGYTVLSKRLGRRARGSRNELGSALKDRYERIAMDDGRKHTRRVVIPVVVCLSKWRSAFM
jgi:hypothetical protein